MGFTVRALGLDLRLLSPPVHRWLEDNFTENDEVHVTVTRLDDNEIQISLRPEG